MNAPSGVRLSWRVTFWFAVALTLLYLGLGNALAAEDANAWSLEEMNEQIDQTNFVVNKGCSGTLIDTKNRYLLTAEHCVRGLYETVEVEDIGYDGTIKKREVRRVVPGTVKQLYFDGPFEVREVTYRTKLMVADKDSDLAIVQVLAELPNTRAAALSCDDPVRGEPVFIVGNPAGVLYSSVVQGIVSSIQRSYETIQVFGPGLEDQALMQISGGVIGGNSGGAVYNNAGQIIGVTVRGSPVNEVLGFAAPLEAISDLLTDNRRKLDTEFGKCGEQK